ncbi:MULTISPECIES: esterase-like activity of phytase family protein [unclassified Leisingera]|uniref:esterase-like activity of phytase family protein n=1 Tax=unclassified Leisingera TaxID=2614906 RepID=UPI00031A2E8B|nr:MULTISPECIES: esterase-like activity of phytase family protein [unclassified Leisingera]KIC22671.1 ABC-type cobalamin/Fe3+-siderophores transport system, ATPase component [Leisingera sp. ANG-S3]KIC51685.1 ABC-type cobalamin/Fe3+-siderophores transport system, ATPase component [Leisingera sp. ANG-S]KID08871.1 ABC-type cobalamin/Fe3+-siderophores transport system, ATPase component [Leisingera sp. ANG1]
MRRRSAIKLILAVAAAAGLAAAGYAASRPLAADSTAQYLGSYTWTLKKPWFGGFSALKITDGGRAMVVLSDRATLVTTDIQRKGGRISGITARTAHRLRASTGKTLRGFAGDSEGLAIAPDGSRYISFEGAARVARYRRPDSRAKVLPRPKGFRKLPPNKSLETLAINARGHLYTLPERAYDKHGQIPVWRWNGRRWSRPFSLPPRGGFLPVDADFGPDGRFYLLERDLTLLGFRSRLRRWDITDSGLENETVLLQTGPGTHDNLEGLSVWTDASGRMRATMVSDDNFLPVQRTELVEYALPR